MTLTIQDLGALGELLGSVAVLATLVYLALQTRQNTMAIGAQLEAALIAARQESLLVISTSNELGEALNQQRIRPRPIEQDRVQSYWGAQMIRWQWQFQHARRGLLPIFSEAGTGGAIRLLFATSRGLEGYWEVMKANLLPEFVEWVEEQRSKAA